MVAVETAHPLNSRRDETVEASVALQPTEYPVHHSVFRECLRTAIGGLALLGLILMAIDRLL